MKADANSDHYLLAATLELKKSRKKSGIVKIVNE